MKNSSVGLRFILMGAAFLALRCGGPSYNQKAGVPPPVFTKPGECKVAFDKTCWRDTIRKVTECMKPDKGNDQFSASHQLCGNDSGKLVVFMDPINLFSRPFDSIHSMIHFKVVPDHVNECFEVKGTLSNLELKIIKTGETAKFTMDAEKMSFTCIDGQQVVVPRKNVEDCSQTLKNNSLPGVAAGPFYDGKIEKGWFFQFRGLGEESGTVFRCLH